VPFLAYCNINMQKAVATSSACGLPIAIAGSIGFGITGLNESGLPAWSSGYIYWPAFAGITIASALFAPLGARLAHALRGMGIQPGDRVVVSLQRGEQGIECAVCDSGPGIPAEHLPHVTRRFYRVSPREGEGSGLGLAVVEEILRRHQSRLEIESRAEGPETGTCAHFVLPAREAGRDEEVEK